jgi:7-cyano-7-deazaguanine synthase in queuosine biosynthesis
MFSPDDLSLFRLTYQAAAQSLRGRFVMEAPPAKTELAISGRFYDEVGARLSDRTFQRYLSGLEWHIKSAWKAEAAFDPVLMAVDSEPPEISLRIDTPGSLERTEYPLVIPWSGGLDGTGAYLYATKVLGYRPDEVLLLSINYGFIAKEAQTRRVLSRLLRETIDPNLNHLEVTILSDGAEVRLPKEILPCEYIVPLRNHYLFQLAMLFGRNVWLSACWHPSRGLPGIVTDDWSDFWCQMSEAGTCYHRRPIQVVSPFAHQTKASMIRMLHDECGDGAVELLSHCTTCYHDTLPFCGRCFACWGVQQLDVDLEDLGTEHRFYQGPEIPAELVEVYRKRALPPKG